MSENKEVEKKDLEVPVEIDLSDIPTLRSDDYRTIYSNFANISFSPWDIRLTLGLIDDNGENELRNVTQTSILMSPEFAHVLLRVLNDNLRQWRDKYTKKMEVSRKPDRERLRSLEDEEAPNIDTSKALSRKIL